MAIPGEYDDLLKWPALVILTIELVNQCGCQNVKSHRMWGKPIGHELTNMHVSRNSSSGIQEKVCYISILNHLDIHSF